jgi:hypothetical protein
MLLGAHAAWTTTTFTPPPWAGSRIWTGALNARPACSSKNYLLACEEGASGGSGRRTPVRCGWRKLRGLRQRPPGRWPDSRLFAHGAAIELSHARHRIDTEGLHAPPVKEVSKHSPVARQARMGLQHHFYRLQGEALHSARASEVTHGSAVTPRFVGDAPTRLPRPEITSSHPHHRDPPRARQHHHRRQSKTGVRIVDVLWEADPAFDLEHVRACRRRRAGIEGPHKVASRMRAQDWAVFCQSHGEKMARSLVRSCRATFFTSSLVRRQIGAGRQVRGGVRLTPAPLR